MKACGLVRGEFFLMQTFGTRSQSQLHCSSWPQFDPGRLEDMLFKEDNLQAIKNPISFVGTVGIQKNAVTPLMPVEIEVGGSRYHYIPARSGNQLREPL